MHTLHEIRFEIGSRENLLLVAPKKQKTQKTKNTPARIYHTFYTLRLDTLCAVAVARGCDPVQLRACRLTSEGGRGGSADSAVGA